ncbi:MAG TPA: RNA 3'-terminal phosphate cyclase [Candidatus Melainabacteria bacterium]|nr:RNA 3'-terminal phosphate cyclase [Candidatus Melainabacteria bacterium]
MIEVDGSRGEGGGQIIRTSLSLAMVTGKAFRISNIRAKRSKPGLQKQHLTCVQAAAQMTGARVEGDRIGSLSITFEPGSVASGDYYFDVGTAGSTSLVFQTILYALLTEKEPSTVRLKGGTHNPFAPSADFLASTFLPSLRLFGPELDFRLHRYGFYPRGGGEIEIKISPNKNAKLKEIDLLDAHFATRPKASVLLAGLPRHIAEREMKSLKSAIRELDQIEIIETKKSASPGNAVHIFQENDHFTETFTALGERGRRAEVVAELAAQEYKDYRESGAVVGSHLADQLLIPMALSGGGRFSTVSPTDHTLTNIDTIKQFLDVDITLKDMSANLFKVELIH